MRLNLFLTQLPKRLVLVTLAAAALVQPAPAQLITWDKQNLRAIVQKGQGMVFFSIGLTNASSAPVVIKRLRPHCDCTTVRSTAELPATVVSGASLPIEITTDLKDRHETFTQVIAIETPKETNRLVLEIIMPELTTREKNQRAAFADRQAVFKKDCAVCHWQPALSKPIDTQYKVLCGTCHDAVERASVVPDLHQPSKTKRDHAYWSEWIRRGKPGTFMPAFEKRFGGPLTEAELQRLIDFVAERFPDR